MTGSPKDPVGIRVKGIKAEIVAIAQTDNVVRIAVGLLEQNITIDLAVSVSDQALRDIHTFIHTVGKHLREHTPDAEVHAEDPATPPSEHGPN